MIQNILTSPEPNLPDNGLYSEELRDLRNKILTKDPKKRPTAAELMLHPWFSQNNELNINISEWVTTLLFTCKFQKTITYDETDLANRTIVLNENGYTNINGNIINIAELSNASTTALPRNGNGYQMDFEYNN